MNCERCFYGVKCPVLNKQECPINKLWERAKELRGNIEKLSAIAEAERIIKEGVKHGN